MSIHLSISTNFFLEPVFESESADDLNQDGGDASVQSELASKTLLGKGTYSSICHSFFYFIL